jgi:ferredoxin
MSDEFYRKITENLDQGPLMAPKADGAFSPAFLEFLKLQYTPEEAELVQHIGMVRRSGRTAVEVAEATGRAEEEVGEALARMAGDGRLLRFGDTYLLPAMPVVLNHRFHKQEVGLDDEAAVKLYRKFFIEDGFYRNYESSAQGTQIARVVPVRRSIEYEQKVLDTEDAHDIIDGVTDLSLVPCPCRTRSERLGNRECQGDKPIGCCIIMEAGARYFQAIGVGRKVTAEEAKKYFDEMQDYGLVGTTDNFEDTGHSVICLCCACCCSQLGGRTRWDNPEAVAPANFVTEAGDDCVMCGVCEDRCLFAAITLDDDVGRAVVDPAKCMGCGVCTITCAQETLRLRRLERETPLADARELYTRIAIENRGGAVPR